MSMSTALPPITDRTAFGDLPEVATRKEVSDFLRISIPTLARWAAEGKGPKYRKAGSRVLYRREDVLDWFDSLEEAS